MREMKDSGIEWIGSIPNDWRTGYIGQLYDERVEKVSDKDYQPLSVTMKGIVYQLSTAAKSDAHDNRKLVKKGDFAINSRSDRRGSCGISEYDGSVSLINIVLEPKENMIPEFYNWLFHTQQFADEFYKWGHGIVDDLWTTNWQDMKKIAIPLLPIDKQKNIANFINLQCLEIDNILEKTRESIEEYKKLKQAVITEAVTKGIHGNRNFKETKICWCKNIPIEWKIVSIKILFNIISGATPKSDIPEFWDENIIWITPADFKTNDKYVCSGKRNISSKGYDSCGTTLIPENNLIFSKRAPVGTVCINKTKLCTNQGCLSCIAKDNVNVDFYYYMFSCLTEQFELVSSGTTFKEISLDTFSNFKIPEPSYAEQKDIANYLDEKCSEIDKIIEQKEQYITEIENYKKSLIYEYVTGKKEV